MVYQNISAYDLGEAEYQIWASGFSSFDEVAFTVTPLNAVARLDAKQWERVICACVEARYCNDDQDDYDSLIGVLEYL